MEIYIKINHRPKAELSKTYFIALTFIFISQAVMSHEYRKIRRKKDEIDI